MDRYHRRHLILPSFLPFLHSFLGSFPTYFLCLWCEEGERLDRRHYEKEKISSTQGTDECLDLRRRPLVVTPTPSPLPSKTKNETVNKNKTDIL